MNIFDKMISEILESELDDAFDLGYTVKFDSQMDGLALQLYGFSDKI